MKVTAELAKPQRLRPRVLPTQLRASLIEPLVRSTACANPRFDLQVVVPYLGKPANYGAIPTITKSPLSKNACGPLQFSMLCGTTSFGTLDICIDKEMMYTCCGSTPRDVREYLLMGQAEANATNTQFGSSTRSRSSRSSGIVDKVLTLERVAHANENEL